LSSSTHNLRIWVQKMMSLMPMLCGRLGAN
jgi:hypothetical protein